MMMPRCAARCGICSSRSGCGPPCSNRSGYFRGQDDFLLYRQKILQNILPVCWGERFFADSAMNQAARKFGVRTHTNKLVARCASWAHEIGSFSHDGPWLKHPTNELDHTMLACRSLRRKLQRLERRPRYGHAAVPS